MANCRCTCIPRAERQTRLPHCVSNVKKRHPDPAADAAALTCPVLNFVIIRNFNKTSPASLASDQNAIWLAGDTGENIQHFPVASKHSPQRGGLTGEQETSDGLLHVQNVTYGATQIIAKQTDNMGNTRSVYHVTSHI